MIFLIRYQETLVFQRIDIINYLKKGFKTPDKSGKFVFSLDLIHRKYLYIEEILSIIINQL